MQLTSLMDSTIVDFNPRVKYLSILLFWLSSLLHYHRHKTISSACVLSTLQLWLYSVLDGAFESSITHICKVHRQLRCLSVIVHCWLYSIALTPLYFWIFHSLATIQSWSIEWGRRFAIGFWGVWLVVLGYLLSFGLGYSFTFWSYITLSDSLLAQLTFCLLLSLWIWLCKRYCG